MKNEKGKQRNMMVVLTIIFITIVFIIIALVLGINFYVVASSKSSIVSEKQAMELENIDCILILGAQALKDRPSHMLEDRLTKGISLYHNGVAPKIIMSGDHGREEYDEVNIMKDYAIKNNVKSEDIFMDHAGFSTYESIYRAKEIFKAKKIVIVTQEYHLYRAVYVAKQLGLEAYGIATDPKLYSGQAYRELREILARDKDWFQCIIKPEPTYLGEAIPVSGNGDITNDK